tara:strand:- start:3407 stop:3682 length:276 start_codon:yes stop_codon:yes gene_type:complete
MPTTPSWVKLEEDEEIYIDCNPVDTNNPDEVTLTDDTPSDSVIPSLDGDQLMNNIGFQSVLGIALFGIMYFVGNYVFKQLPSNVIQDRINS